MRQHIALFGGSFDPMHNGHVNLIKKVQALDLITETIVIPCKQSPHKANATSASGSDRIKMASLATRHLSNVQVSDYEINNNLEASYSWMTVNHFSKTHPLAKLYWILGTDQWNALERWSRSHYLLEKLHFIVIERQEEVVYKEKATYTPVAFDFKISSTEVRKELNQGYHPTSLSKEVTEYITEHELYKTTG